jgi:hypothetical protein
MDLRFRLGQAFDRVRAGDIRGLLGLVRKRLHSETLRVAVRKEPTEADEARSATAEHPVRIASMADIEAVLDPARGRATDANEIWQRRLRRHVAATVGPDRCYVADCGDLGPSFMQFLFFPEDNDILQAELAPDARSLPFAAASLVQVAVEARRRGVQSIITHIPIGNKGALFSSHSAGYYPFGMRRSRYRLFRRHISYEPYTGSMSSLLRDPSPG